MSARRRKERRARTAAVWKFDTFQCQYICIYIYKYMYSLYIYIYIHMCCSNVAAKSKATDDTNCSRDSEGRKDLHFQRA